MASGQGKRLSVEERREQLLQLGMQLFNQRPYDEVSIDEIAEAAGVSKGLLYHYFSSKRGLYLAVVEAAVDELIELTEPPAELAPEAALRHGLRAYLDYVEQHRVGYLTVMQGGVGADPEVEQLVDRMRRRTAERIVEGLELEVVPDRLWAGLRGWVGFVEGVVGAWLGGREITRHELVEACVTSLGAVLVALTGWRAGLRAVVRGRLGRLPGT